MDSKRIGFFILIFSLMLQPALVAETDDLLFVVFGDSRPAYQGAPIPVAFERILAEINLINPDLVIHTGDLVYGYGDSEEQLRIEYSNIGKRMASVVPRIYYVPGNHDFQTLLTTRYFRQMTGQKKDYFSFDHKGVRFIILNTDIPGQVGEIAGEQLEWLEKELRKHSRPVFVFMHRPLFSFLLPDADKKGDLAEPMYNFVSEKARWAVIDLLTRHKVTAVFAGHEHLYYRTDYKGIPFITLGGGGATFSVPPDKGGFFHYMIVSVKGKEVEFDLMEPYHFAVETKTYNKDGKTYGEALIHNIHGEVFEGIIPLRGIRFTLPKGRYTVKAESVVSPSQMVKAGESLGIVEAEMEEAKEKEIQALIAQNLKPTIYKIEPNSEDPNMLDMWVGLDAPGTFSVRLILIPEF
jgi:predicted phosphodiesterase